jgi:hypothetical protein
LQHLARVRGLDDTPLDPKRRLAEVTEFGPNGLNCELINEVELIGSSFEIARIGNGVVRGVHNRPPFAGIGSFQDLHHHRSRNRLVGLFVKKFADQFPRVVVQSVDVRLISNVLVIIVHIRVWHLPRLRKAGAGFEALRADWLLPPLRRLRVGFR